VEGNSSKGYKNVNFMLACLGKAGGHASLFGRRGFEETV
jgi:hypothetical protein